ncbi:MAG: universal stress protein [Bacillota bacterium]
MKMLVCVDGSEQSKRALEKAAMIAEGCGANEVAIIHVYDHSQDMTRIASYKELTVEEVEKFKNMVEKHKEDQKKILEDALKFFEEKNIKARTIFREGHPAREIVSVACEEEFDLIVLGSRGLSGLQRIFLGSVSSAVIQQAKNSDVLTVK